MGSVPLLQNRSMHKFCWRLMIAVEKPVWRLSEEHLADDEQLIDAHALLTDEDRERPSGPLAAGTFAICLHPTRIFRLALPLLLPSLSLQLVRLPPALGLRRQVLVVPARIVPVVWPSSSIASLLSLLPMPPPPLHPLARLIALLAARWAFLFSSFLFHIRHPQSVHHCGIVLLLGSCTRNPYTVRFSRGNLHTCLARYSRNLCFSYRTYAKCISLYRPVPQLIKRLFQ